jgi:outer membrane biogenesis lipoprotein LolB
MPAVTVAALLAAAAAAMPIPLARRDGCSTFDQDQRTLRQIADYQGSE